MQKMVVKKEVAEDILQKYRPDNYENLDMEIQKAIDEVIELDIEKGFNPDTPFTYELIEFDNQNGTHIERLQKVAIKDVENAVFKGKIKNYWKTRKERQILNNVFNTEFNKYFEDNYKEAQKKSIKDLREYVINNSKNSKGSFYRNVEKYSYMSKEKNINVFCDKYVKELGEKAALFEANKKTLYEKIPGITDIEKKEVIEILQKNCEKFPYIKFSLANYKKLFNKPVSTPIGNVKFGVHQSVKFKIYDREYLLKAVDITLRNPAIIVKTREENYLFVKQFKDENNDKFVSSVVIDKGELIDVSNHEKKLNEILNMIRENGIEYKKNARVEKSNLSCTGNHTITQKNKLSSKIKPDYDGKNVLHKSFDITVTDITENNKQKKIEQVEKSLNAMADNIPFVIKHIDSDDSKKYDNITLRIRNFDKSKIEKAVRSLSFSLNEPLKAAKGEVFTYKCQEELTNRIVQELTNKTREVYQFVINYFGLPEMTIVQKAYLQYKGKIIFNPETGKPVKKSDWKKFAEALEKLLTRYNGTGEKIVLSAQSLGMILERLSKTNSLEAIKKMKLDDIKYNHRSFDWISESVKNMTNIFGETLTRDRQSRVQAAIDSAAQRVTRVTNDLRDNIQQIILDGVKDKQSKSQISQNLFDKCVGMNRDIQKITDTEIQNNTTSAYINEEVYNTKDGTKVYFKRFEVVDDNTCKKCKALKDKIVLFSDKPLESENIKDEYTDKAIWEGKQDGIPFSISHPYCRGTWFRYYPELD